LNKRIENLNRTLITAKKRLVALKEKRRILKGKKDDIENSIMDL